MADFLLALADFDRKKLWRELGHTSLFYYLHRELRLSKGAAQNRKTAAELVQGFPEVEAALRAGELCLSTVNEVARVLTPENRAEVLPRFFGLSRREAEAVAMSLRPAEVVPTRDVITAIPPALPAPRAAIVQAALPAASPEAPPVRVQLDEPQPVAVHLDEPTAPVVLTAPMPLPAPAPRRESVELRGADVARGHFTVSRRFIEKLEAAKDALGHACPGGSAAEILERGLDLVLAQHAKRRGLVEKPRKSLRASRSDTIPAEVKREVWRRAAGQCEWRFESGERCGCRRRLEYDHIEPLALGRARRLCGRQASRTCLGLTTRVRTVACRRRSRRMKTMRRNHPTREYQPDQPSNELTRPAPGRLHGSENVPESGIVTVVDRPFHTSRSRRTGPGIRHRSGPAPSRATISIQPRYAYAPGADAAAEPAAGLVTNHQRCAKSASAGC